MVNPSNMAIMICIISYGGGVSVGTVIDPAVVKDADLYMRCVQDELDDIAASG
jgi:hypothetical protein